MGSKAHATLEFSQPFRGTGMNDRNCMIKIGGKEKEAGPYDLLLMSLGSCLYSTFEDILGTKSVLMGFGLESDAIHSPNENFALEQFFNGIDTITEFYKASLLLIGAIFFSMGDNTYKHSLD